MRLKRPLTAVAACLWPIGAHANVGVPLFTNLVVYSWLLLLPIIGIEAYLLRRELTVSIGRAVAVAGWANLVSTFLGSFVIFAAGLALAIPGLVVLPGSQSDITVLIALVPCFYLSVYIESRVAGRYLQGAGPGKVWDVFLLANKFSYALLGIVAIANFIKNWILHGYIIW